MQNGYVPFGIEQPQDPSGKTEPLQIYDPLAAAGEHEVSEPKERHTTDQPPTYDASTYGPTILYDRGQFAPLVYKAMQAARLDELGKWEKWTLKRLGKMEKTAAEFKAQFITAAEVDMIREDLVKSKLPDEVRHIFATRKKKIPPLRIQPPRAGEAAGQVADLQNVLRSILQKEVDANLPPSDEETIDGVDRKISVADQIRSMKPPKVEIPA